MCISIDYDAAEDDRVYPSLGSLGLVALEELQVRQRARYDERRGIDRPRPHRNRLGRHERLWGHSANVRTISFTSSSTAGFTGRLKVPSARSGCTCSNSLIVTSWQPSRRLNVGHSRTPVSHRSSNRYTSPRRSVVVSTTHFHRPLPPLHASSCAPRSPSITIVACYNCGSD